MKRRLEGKVALVTGGAGGLGLAIAQRLGDEGAISFMSDILVEQGKALALKAGFNFLEHDVSSEESWAKTVFAVEKAAGQLDILVNNAAILGTLDRGCPESTLIEDWRRVFAVNAEGVFLGCRAGIGAMRRSGGGAIVNISSVASLSATPNATAYGASKAVVQHLTRSVAQHCAQEKLRIRCNSVHPGIARTAMWDTQAQASARMRGLTFSDIVTQAEARNPSGELARPEDIAAAVAFLASDDAHHITGERLTVDGGSVSCDTYLALKLVNSEL